MPQNLDAALKYSQRWVDIVHKTEVTEAEERRSSKNQNITLQSISIGDGWSTVSR